MWHTVTSQLPEHKYNPMYNKDFIPDFDAPLEERGFRVPPEPVPRPDTPWQRFLDEHGYIVWDNILNELDNLPTGELHCPKFTEDDLNYSNYLLSKSLGTFYEDWLFHFYDLADQADKLSWYVFEHSPGIANICKDTGIAREDLLAILSGDAVKSLIPIHKLLKYFGVTPEQLYYKIKDDNSYDTTHLFRTANSVG